MASLVRSYQLNDSHTHFVRVDSTRYPAQSKLSGLYKMAALWQVALLLCWLLSSYLRQTNHPFPLSLLLTWEEHFGIRIDLGLRVTMKLTQLNVVKISWKLPVVTKQRPSVERDATLPRSHLVFRIRNMRTRCFRPLSRTELRWNPKSKADRSRRCERTQE